jgi:hypothetical protein
VAIHEKEKEWIICGVSDGYWDDHTIFLIKDNDLTTA